MSEHPKNLAAKAVSKMEPKDKKSNFTPQPKVPWYSIGQLARTGVKVVLSSIFGHFSDRRELLAIMGDRDDHKCFEDFAHEQELWVDFVADAGDGFDAGFTVARQMARAQDAGSTSRKTQPAKLLIMGGDQVYPTANIEEYENRLKGPYSYAFPKDVNKDRKLFAIPGNHDWYDGLSSFVKIFSAGGSLGDFTTPQSRSYFALKLPHNVWIFGVDVQLQSYIDKGQLEYFESVIDECLSETETNHVVLCSAESSWVYQMKKKSGDDLRHNLAYFEKKVMENTGEKELKIVLSLSGDLHHYSRYTNTDGTHHKITAGGGGAFLHPTHNLPDKISWKEKELSLEMTYPSKPASKQLSYGNLFFGWNNSSFALFLGALYIIAGWFFSVSTFVGNFSFGFDLAGIKLLLLLALSPFAAIMIGIVAFGTFFFADRDPINPKYKTNLVYGFAGILHAALQVTALIVSFLLISTVFQYQFHDTLFVATLLSMGLFVLGMGLAGSIVSSTIFGLYLLITNRWLGMHDNEAFSALNLERYKNFLRLHITKERITIYPYGIPKVFPHSYSAHRDLYLPKEEPVCELIEDPIVIELQ